MSESGKLGTEFENIPTPERQNVESKRYPRGGSTTHRLGFFELFSKMPRFLKIFARRRRRHQNGRCGSLLENRRFPRVSWFFMGLGSFEGCQSKKKLKPKDSIRPRWGIKKRKRFWLPPKKDLLSVGWSFRISISKGEVKIQFQREK